jgi:hypothetical protein
MRNKNNEENKGRLAVSEKRSYHVTANVSQKNHAELKKIANGWGVGSGPVLRKLIKHVISGKILLLDLLRLSKKKNEKEDFTSLSYSERHKTVCARLTEGENIEFHIISNNWDFAPGTLARLLVQFFLEMEDKDSIWI